MARNTSGLPNREFVQLAHDMEFGKYDIGGWFWSEKLDGQRMIWDGGLTRGLRVEEVPFANIEKTDRFVNQEYATGLWSRYGHPIRASQWWIDALPNVPLDGEAYIGRGMFEATMSITRAHESSNWHQVKYNLIETLNLESWFRTGFINNKNFVKRIDETILGWVLDRAKVTGVRNIEAKPFGTQPRLLEILAPANDVVRHIKQSRLPMASDNADDEATLIMEDICRNGGEGIIVRNSSVYWTPHRTTSMLKVVPELTSEAKIIGFNTGKDGYRGMLGALIVAWGKKEFKISGFKLPLRQLNPEDSARAKLCPDTRMDDIKPVGFQIGDVITFKYKELTAYGIPKTARYWRHYQ